VLETQGYEPRVGAEGITLSNCPFASLAQDHTALVCGMNLDLMRGLLDGLAEGLGSSVEGLASSAESPGSSAEGPGSSAEGPGSSAYHGTGDGAPPLRARLTPAAGRCCVTLSPPA
jgi:hypothetical protein